MTKSITQVVEEILAVLPPLKPGFYVKPSDDLSEGIVIGNDELAFAITREEISDNRHIMRAKNGYPDLLAAIAQHHAMIAMDADPKMAKSIVDAS